MMQIPLYTSNGFHSVGVVSGQSLDAIHNAIIDSLQRAETNRACYRPTMSDFASLEWVERGDHTTARLTTGMQTRLGYMSVTTYYTTRTGVTTWGDNPPLGSRDSMKGVWVETAVLQ